ncbi:MAG: S1C family serine protease, partial [Actinobacteria bacterium]|nr:S1C family serine protease [Actinomycetota bacterium]
MADEHTPGDEHSEPGAPVDRPRPPSPWEPAPDPAAPPPSPWAPAPPPEAPTPTPGPADPPAPPEAWENPLASPDAWVNPLAEESAETEPPPTPAPSWQVASPTPPGWGEPTVTVPARPPAGRRPLLLAAATGAVVGALVAGLVVAVLKDDKAAGPGRSLAFSSNTSKFARTGDIQEILAKVEPAVVAIRTRTLSLGDFLKPVPGEGAGTGFVIGRDGVIVTNNHVVAGAQSIEVVFADDRKMPARVLGRDPTTDLAVL